MSEWAMSEWANEWWVNKRIPSPAHFCVHCINCFQNNSWNLGLLFQFDIFYASLKVQCTNLNVPVLQHFLVLVLELELLLADCQALKKIFNTALPLLRVEGKSSCPRSRGTWVPNAARMEDTWPTSAEIPTQNPWGRKWRKSMNGWMTWLTESGSRITLTKLCHRTRGHNQPPRP